VYSGTYIYSFLGIDEKWCKLWESADCRKHRNHKLTFTLIRYWNA
jgi:hypothetical protein